MGSADGVSMRVRIACFIPVARVRRMADIEDLDRFRTLPLPKAVEDIRLKAMDNDDRHFTKALLKDLIKKSGTAGDIW